MLPELWQLRFRRALYLGYLAIVGFCFALPPLFLGRIPSVPLFALGMLLVVPGFVYFYVLVIWHWKARYIGKHSDLWGGIILIETSGWFKIVYLLRHIIPDARGTGRYYRSKLPPVNGGVVPPSAGESGTE